MASDLALSPSVRIRVHAWEFLPPASLASSSLGMPGEGGWVGGKPTLNHSCTAPFTLLPPTTSHMNMPHHSSGIGGWEAEFVVVPCGG